MQFLVHDTRRGFKRCFGALRASIYAFLAGGCIVILSSVQTSARQRQADSSTSPAPQAVFEKYCIACHNRTLRTAGLELDRLDLKNPGSNAEVWEKIIAKLRAGSMPPPGIRQFRQFRGCPHDFHGASGTIPVSGPSNHSARDRSASCKSRDRDLRDSLARDSR
jgi:hypothetical protein